ncbi:PAS domain-containing protein [Halobellus sp. EA9]|uniref:PAS domain-containing protein n=1 Tax=Halobellus sp. EA9 TaxID=3421647 RepID=UPI003EC0830E
MDDRLQNAPVGVLVASPDGTLTTLNEVAQSLIDSPDDATGSPLAEIFPRSVEDSLLVAFEDDSVTETSFQEYYPDLERWLDVSVTATDEDVTVYLQDVTQQKGYEQSIEQLRTERKRTAVIEDVLSEILAELVGATSREEIAETICRSLGDADIYVTAGLKGRERDRESR